MGSTITRLEQKSRRLSAMSPIVKAVVSLLLGASCGFMLQGCGGGSDAKPDPVSCTYENGSIKMTATWSCDGDKLMYKVDADLKDAPAGTPALSVPAAQIPGVKCNADELKKLRDANQSCPKSSAMADSAFAAIPAKTMNTVDDETKSSVTS